MKPTNFTVILVLIVFYGIGALSTGCSSTSGKTSNSKEKSITNQNNMSLQMPIVIGEITEIKVAEIPSKAKGGSSRFETWISLSVTEAFDINGDNVDPSIYDYPTFAGDSALINEFNINDRVKITCSSTTGRHIQLIERLIPN